MIVRQFLQWVRTAPAADRADATSALARAYLYSDLSTDDRIAAEGAMLMLLDDPSPLVREALAQALAASPEAPPTVIIALAGDLPEIAGIVLERSPLLIDADLVDRVGGGESWAQAAIARRRGLPRPVAAALAEVGSAEACLILIESPDAEIPAFSLERLIERHGDLAAVREALLARDDLSAANRQALVVKLSASLAGFVVDRNWLAEERARGIAREACEKATVTIAAASPPDDTARLVRHLRDSAQLTPGLILRALLSGNVALFEQALVELSGLPPARVAGLVHDRHSAGLRALYERTGLPRPALPAVQAALDAMHETGFLGEPGGAARLKRRMIERVLTSCEDHPSAEIEPLLMLLRRFATEAAREEARMFCDELAAA
ncbi:MAG TPA: DUF2336 domain-containing protein [Xanthobacteraceae bacterium]|jgi:uncharacterized protein (DUF2336 family)|nr:DUF2336 domain-containing protein [Xanthobacteraceae bacterium]